jgi:hypothetical protein
MLTNGASTRRGWGAAEGPPRLWPLPEKAAEVDSELCFCRALSIALIHRKNEQTGQWGGKGQNVRFIGTPDLINFGLPLQKHESWPVDVKTYSEVFSR